MLDWLSDQQAVLAPYFFNPHPVAVAAVVAYGLFWARLGPPLTPSRPGAWFGFVAGAGVYSLAQVWVRGEPTIALLDVITENIHPDSVGDAQPLLGALEALIAGFAEEIVKLLLMLVVIFAMGYPRDPRAVATAAVAPALGFALFGANAALSPSLQELPVDGDLVFPVIAQGLWIGLNIGTAYLLAKGWLTGRLGLYLLYAGLLHAIAAYTTTLASSGWHLVVVTLILAVAALTAFTGGAGAIPAKR